MTPKEKAEELIEKHEKLLNKHVFNGTFDISQQCALIAVDEIIKNNPHKIIKIFYVDSGGNKTNDNYFEMVSNEFYWQEVKREIEKL